MRSNPKDSDFVGCFQCKKWATIILEAGKDQGPLAPLISNRALQGFSETSGLDMLCLFPGAKYRFMRNFSPQQIFNFVHDTVDIFLLIRKLGAPSWSVNYQTV